MSIHSNSAAAYTEEKDSGRIQSRSISILQCYPIGRALTDREVMTLLGFSDPNKVRPRITELVKSRVLAECGAMKDPVTGKTVRLTRLASTQMRLL